MDEDRDDDRDVWRRHRRRRASGPASACPDERALAAFVDGRTVAGEQEVLEAHLAACPRCQAAVGDALSIEQAPVVALSTAALGRITQAVEAEAAPPMRRPAWAALAAALVLACGAGFWLGARTMTTAAAVERAANALPFDLSPLVSTP